MPQTDGALRDLTLATLRCFLAVAVEGSYTRAAVRLGVSQGTVSSGVRAVEDSVGGELVRRTTRQVALTPLGYEFANQALVAVNDLDLAVESARRRADTEPTVAQ